MMISLDTFWASDGDIWRVIGVNKGHRSIPVDLKGSQKDSRKRCHASIRDCSSSSKMNNYMLMFGWYRVEPAVCNAAEMAKWAKEIFHRLSTFHVCPL